MDSDYHTDSNSDSDADSDSEPDDFHNGSEAAQLKRISKRLKVAREIRNTCDNLIAQLTVCQPIVVNAFTTQNAQTWSEQCRRADELSAASDLCELLQSQIDGSQLEVLPPPWAFARTPKCEVRRCAVYSKLVNALPREIWFLVADYANHHPSAPVVFAPLSADQPIQECKYACQRSIGVLSLAHDCWCHSPKGSTCARMFCQVQLPDKAEPIKKQFYLPVDKHHVEFIDNQTHIRCSDDYQTCWVYGPEVFDHIQWVNTWFGEKGFLRHRVSSLFK